MPSFPHWQQHSLSFLHWLIAGTQLDWSSSRTHTSLICILFNYIICVTTLTAPLSLLVNLAWECCLSNTEVMQRRVWEASVSNREQVCSQASGSAPTWESPEWFQLHGPPFHSAAVLVVLRNSWTLALASLSSPTGKQQELSFGLGMFILFDLNTTV